MENQRVHEYTVETGANGLPVARLGSVHNLITFVTGGSQKIHYLDGRWVDDGNHPIPEDQVPDEIKRQAREIVFNPGFKADAQTLVNCEFCSSQFPSGQYARHLTNDHIRPRAQVAQAVEAAPVPGLDDDVEYVKNEDGTPVLNKDGSPRLRPGRKPA